MPAPEGNDYAVGNEGGRPTKFEKSFVKLARNYCLLGATNEQLATYFEVSLSTIKNWLETEEAFAKAVKAGKVMADANVARALYRRAVGYKFKEVTFEKIADQMTLEITPDEVITQAAYKKKIVTKFLHPDPGAGMNWLKNRQPVTWKEGFDVNLNKGAEIAIWTADEVIAFQQWKASQQPPNPPTDGD